MHKHDDSINYLTARQAQQSIGKKLKKDETQITQELVITYINYSLTLVDYWAKLGLSEHEAKELSELHTELIDASQRISMDTELKKNCIAFANSIHDQWLLVKSQRLN